jgi:transketolase
MTMVETVAGRTVDFRPLGAAATAAARAEAESRCRRLAGLIRRWTIAQSLDSRVGHIGSSLSIADIMAALWGAVLNREAGTSAPGRDRFVLCKGHAAMSLYCCLRWRGLLPEDAFRTYCKDGSMLGAHPEHALPGVDVSTGSLGQGLSVAAGIALGQRGRKLPGRTFALLSDAECNEGQVWEAAMFAGHHRLSNLTAVVDVNGLQALGDTAKILDIESRQPDIWRSFGWTPVVCDGHDVPALLDALAPAKPDPEGRPRVVLAQTHMGRGVSFMTDKLEWHYRNLTPELAAAALAELDRAAAADEAGNGVAKGMGTEASA